MDGDLSNYVSPNNCIEDINLNPKDLKKIIIDTSTALENLYRIGIVCDDIKPENFLYQQTENGLEIKAADYQLWILFPEKFDESGANASKFYFSDHQSRNKYIELLKGILDVRYDRTGSTDIISKRFGQDMVNLFDEFIYGKGGKQKGKFGDMGFDELAQKACVIIDTKFGM